MLSCKIPSNVPTVYRKIGIRAARGDCTRSGQRCHLIVVAPQVEGRVGSDRHRRVLAEAAICGGENRAAGDLVSPV